MSEEFQVGVIGAVSGFVGVLIGGGITFAIQWHFTRREEKRLGRTQLVRIQFLVNACATHIVQLGRALRRNIPDDHQGHLWPVVLPIATSEHPALEISVDDISVLKGAGVDDFINELAEVTRIHNIAYSTLKQFNTARTELRNRLAPFSQISIHSESATVEFDSREHPEIVAVIHECESLSSALMRLTEEGTEKCARLVGAFNAVAEASKERIKGKRVPKLEIDPDRWRLTPKR